MVAYYRTKRFKDLRDSILDQESKDKASHAYLFGTSLNDPGQPGIGNETFFLKLDESQMKEIWMQSEPMLPVLASKLPPVFRPLRGYNLPLPELFYADLPAKKISNTLDTFTQVKDDDFEIISTDGTPVTISHRICRHCKQRVEQSIINVSKHLVNCLEREEGLVIGNVPESWVMNPTPIGKLNKNENTE